MTTDERTRIQHRTDEEAQRVARETRIDLDAFLALRGEDRAARWRQWPSSAKQDAVIQMLGRRGVEWTHELVAHWTKHYDEKFAASPVEAAVEGALERLALEHANAARLADRLGDKAHRKAERAATTAFTNALAQYRAGVRPQLLDSGAWLVPSSTPGKAAHLITMDGDWVCSCAAGASIHWPIALIIGLEVAHDHMQAFDDGDGEPSDDEGAVPGVHSCAHCGALLHCDCDDEDYAPAPNPIPHAAQAAQWLEGKQQLARRLAETAAYLDALRDEQRRTAAPAEPTPRQLGVRLMQDRKRSAVFASAFYLGKAA